MIEHVVDARDRWLAATPSERAERGPEAMRTCSRALMVLTERLAGRGYPVTEPIEPCPDVAGAVAQLADAGITPPPALVALWTEVGAISLVDLGRYRHVPFWDAVAGSWRATADAGVGASTVERCCDGIVVDGPASDGWLDHVIEVVEELADQGLPAVIEIAPDDLHKDNVSGGDPYGVVLPGPGEDPWLAPLDGFRWPTPRPLSAPPDPPDLVGYLRTAVLECGGFPGLFGHPAYAGVLAELTEDLPVF